MKDSLDEPSVMPTDGIAAIPACRNCGTALTRREYYCPECDAPHFPHLGRGVYAPLMQMLAFALVIAGPVAAYSLWVYLTALSAR